MSRKICSTEDTARSLMISTVLMFLFEIRRFSFKTAIVLNYLFLSASLASQDHCMYALNFLLIKTKIVHV